MKKILTCLLIMTLAGCATKISRPSSSPQPSKIPFGKFRNVEMKHVELAPHYAEHSANQTAAEKVEYHLSGMQSVFHRLDRLHKDEKFSRSKTRTLQITPKIKEVKFISSAARFWAGAFAGSSAILMEVEFRDSRTGKIIAKPQFYRDVSAFASSWTFGSVDKKMLEEVAQDIIRYASYNK